MKFSKVAFAFTFLLLSARLGYAQTVSRVDITAGSTFITVGQTITATAAAKDVDGNVIPNIAMTWTSGTPTVATAVNGGVVTAVFPGTVQIRARAPNNVQGTLNFTVVPLRVELTAPDSVRLNTSATLSARALDIRSTAIPNVAFTWASDNTGVATVTAQGVVQAVGLGETIISVANSGYMDSKAIRVERSPDFTLDPVVTTDFEEGSNSQIQSISSVSKLNARGDIAFVANLSGKTSAVLREVQGQVTGVARTGDPAPFGGVYNTFGQPAINGQGDVAFTANVSNGIGPILFLARGTELIPLLVGGDTLEVGGVVGTITMQADGLDDAGFVYIHLTISNPNHSGVFRVSAETGVQPLLRTFDEISIGTPTALGPVSVSPDGRAAVLVTAGARRGIYIASPTGVATPVVVDGATSLPGTTFNTFVAVRSVSSTELFFTATPQGGASTLYRVSSGAITEVVRGGTVAGRTIAVTSLLAGAPGVAIFSGSVSDLGAGIFSWSGGSLSAIAIRNTAMPGGEILTFLNAGWVNAAGESFIFGVTDRHLNAIHRITSQGRSVRWATGSIVPVVANYNVVFSSTLRPGNNVTYFLAGSPTGLFQKSGNVVTPIAVPGMRSSRGVYTGVTNASSNANGDLVFLATSLNLTTLTTTAVIHRFSSGTATELVAFGQQYGVAGLGARLINNPGFTALAINNAGQVAFVGTVDNRATLLVTGAQLNVLAQASAVSPTGGTFTGFNNLQITPAGLVFFTGAVTGGPTGGIFLASNGQVTPVATIAEYAGLGAPVVGGEVVYFVGRRSDNRSGLWAYSNGAVQQVVSVGGLLPINVTISNVFGYSAQEDGTLAFQATAATFTGIFTRRADGTMSTVALVSEPTPLAGRYTSFGALAVANSLVVVNSQLIPDRSAVFVAWPQGRQPSPPLTTTDFSIVNRSAVSLRTEGQSASMTVGYANVRAAAGSTSPAGLAIFSLRQGNVLISEATVPVTALVQEGRIYAEVNGPTNTGIAIANPGTQPATVTFYYTDSAGQDLASGVTTIPAGGQIARFLDQSPFNGPTSHSGTFTFASSQPVSVIALRGYVNERSEFLMTTLPVAPVSSNESAPVYFPHFADGGGWTSQIVLVNPNASAITGSVQIFGRQGNTTSEYTIAPRSSYVFRTPGTASATDSGWVQVTPLAGTNSPSGLLIFTFKRNGVVVSEAGVPSSATGSTFRLYLESAGNINAGQVGSIQTGIAIANPGNTSVTVSLDTTNVSGASMGIAGSVTIPAQSQVATFVNQVTGMDTLLAAQGVLRINATGPVAVMGLRARYNERSDFLITTVEPTNETSPASTGDRYMPHFVDSGGYTTQFIVYSGTVNQTSNGSIRFFSQSGQPLGLTLR